MKKSVRGFGLDIVSPQVKILMLLFLVLGICGFVAFWCQEKTGEAFQLLVLTLTLDALVAYAFYYYLLARDAYIPAITAEFEEVEDEPFSFKIVLQNHCGQFVQVSIECKATEAGTPLKIEPINPFNLEPFGRFENTMLGRSEKSLFTEEFRNALVGKVFANDKVPISLEIVVKSIGLKSGVEGEPIQIIRNINFSLN